MEGRGRYKQLKKTDIEENALDTFSKNSSLIYSSFPLGAHLVTSTSHREHNFLTNYVLLYEVDYYYIGLDRRQDFLTYFWQDNKFYAYANWTYGHPSTSIFDRCTVISKRDGGRWMSVDCVDEFNFICEYERGTYCYNFVISTRLLERDQIHDLILWHPYQLPCQLIYNKSG